MKYQQMKYQKCVYFIGGTDGPIKIGISDDVDKRIVQLQTGSAWKLRVMARIIGDRELEQHYHTKFALYRMEGEWFARAQPIINEITRLNIDGTSGKALVLDGGIGVVDKVVEKGSALNHTAPIFSDKSMSYTLQEFCKLTGLGMTKTFDLIGTGKLRSVKIGRRRLIPAEAVRELLATGA
jgi:excisionase family DNA binding protein